MSVLLTSWQLRTSQLGLKGFKWHKISEIKNFIYYIFELETSNKTGLLRTN
jgi:hypothetical protein